MKYSTRLTLFLLAMFVVTQLIGLYVVSHYSQETELPYGMKTPVAEQETDFYTSFLPSIIIAFIIAITILFLLTKFKAEFILKVWFFVVIIIALGITFNSFLYKIPYSSLLVLILAIPLAFIKIYKRNFFVHNITELFVYPGIAAVFVPILNIWTSVILLVLISLYDMWAVWKSGIMQKMAKYQMNQLKVFAGFFVPYASSKKQAEQIKKMKKSKSKNKKSIKVNLAILGGGDIIFPLITAGVMFREVGFGAALLVTLGATLGLAFLFWKAEKKKFYPAMPFITAGAFIGMILGFLIF